METKYIMIALLGIFYSVLTKKVLSREYNQVKGQQGLNILITVLIWITFILASYATLTGG